MRDPRDSGWPDEGERTEFEDIAKEWRWAYLRALQGKRWRRQAGIPEPKPMLREALDGWLRHRSGAVAPETYRGDQVVARRLREAFGDVRLDALDLQAWADAMAEDEYKSSTIKQYVDTARVMMKHAGVEPPDVTVHHEGTTGVQTWSDAEMMALRQAADALGLRERVERAIGTGARRRELLGLRWEDFSPTHKSVLIARQWSRRGPVPPKGKRPRVALVLPSYWPYHRAGETGLVEDPPNPTRMTKDFRDLVEAAGLTYVGDVGWHSLRHLYSRLFLEHYGGDLMELASYLGHASVETTRRYYGHYSQSAAIRMGRSKVYGEG